MWCNLANNTQYLCCGVIVIKAYVYHNDGYSSPYEVGTGMFKQMREDGWTTGAKLLQGGFAASEKQSQDMYAELVKLFGEPVYKSETRYNSNSKKQFFTALWDLEGIIDSYGKFIKENAPCAD